MDMRYAMVRTSTSKVETVCMWDGDTMKWQPPAGCTVIQSDIANIGDTWNGSAFTPGPPPSPDPLAPDYARVRAFMTDPQIDAAIAADPATLTAAQQIARKEAIAIRSLVRVIRAELAS